MNRSERIDSWNSLDAAFAKRENPSMSKEQAGPLHLRRVDPTRNMRRFYTFTIQPTLFGGSSLIRHWGRIGTNGQSMRPLTHRKTRTAPSPVSNGQSGERAISTRGVTELVEFCDALR
jgi:hypothetical protein